MIENNINYFELIVVSYLSSQEGGDFVFLLVGKREIRCVRRKIEPIEEVLTRVC